MKKSIIILIIISSLFLFNQNVLAASANLTLSTEKVNEGENFTITVNVNQASSWNIHVATTGPVSGCTIDELSPSDNTEVTNKTFSTTCSAKEEGTIEVKLTGNVNDNQNSEATSISDSKNITVTKKETVSENNQNSTTGNNTKKEEEVKEEKSNNNKIKEISIEGYELEKVDDNNYKLTVGKDVESVTIKATAEDEKAKVTGDGKKNLKDGENKIELTVKSESGEENKITIVITKKEYYKLEDLEELLKDDKTKSIEIRIEEDTKITKEDMKKIKESKKTVKLNYFDNKSTLVYSWTLDGSKIKDEKDFNTKVKFKTKIEEEISKLANNATGLNISFDQEEKFPEGTKLKLYVKDKFKNKSEVYVYYFDKENNKLDLVQKKIKVKNGYIEINPEKSSDYFITNKDIKKKTNDKDEEKKSSILPIIIIISIVLIIGIGLLIYFIKIRPKKRKRKNHINNNNITNNEDINIIKNQDNNLNNVNNYESNNNTNNSYDSYNNDIDPFNNN